MTETAMANRVFASPASSRGRSELHRSCWCTWTETMSGEYDIGEATAQTDSEGNFSFAGLAPLSSHRVGL